MANEAKTYTKVSFGSSNQDEALQGRIWLEGTQKDIVAQLKNKGFEILTVRPSRAVPKVKKEKKAKKTAAKK